jgi:hypothetical protein
MWRFVLMQMADQRRCHHRLQSQGLGDAEDGRGTAEPRQEIGTSPSKTRTILLLVLVIGLSSAFYLLGAWQAKRFGRGDCIAETLNRQTKTVVLRGLHVETHLALTGTPS